MTIVDRESAVGVNLKCRIVFRTGTVSVIGDLVTAPLHRYHVPWPWLAWQLECGDVTTRSSTHRGSARHEPGANPNCE